MPAAMVPLLSAGLTQKETRSMAADFRLSDIDGKFVALSDFRDDIAVLDFWASWCEPCIAQIPILNAVHEKYRNRGVHVVGVVVESGSVKDIRRFLRKHQMNYPVLIGNDDVVNKYKVRVFPMTFVINPQRHIQNAYIGERSTKEQNVERDIQALIAAWGKEE